MKLKGISTFEQHVEKIVLVVMVAVLLAVVSLQFLTQPNMIEAGGSKIPPGEVFGQLETEVNRLRAAVDDPNPPLPQVSTPNLIGTLEEALNAETELPRQLDVAFGPTPAIGGDESMGPVASGPIMAMTVAEPMSPTAYSTWITADPYALEENEELAAYLPNAQPYDIVGVSFETVIDGALTQQLLREGDASHRPIPATWWRSGVAVLEVVAERQELGLDGKWSQAQPVGRIPGAFDIMEGIEEEPTPSELRDIAQRAEDAAEMIVHPPYIPQIAGPEWLPPSEALERDNQYANMSDVDLLRAKRRSLLDGIDRLEKQLAEGPAQRPDRTRDSGGGGGAPGILGPSTTRNPRNPTDTRDADRIREEKRVANINRQIDSKREQVSDIEDELAGLGFPVASDDLASRVDPFAAAEPDESAQFLGNAEFRVWTHDLEVVPGAVYRYRMRVKVNNPIFGKERSLTPGVDNLDLAKERYAYSPWSGWSDPVMVGRESYLFLSSADEAKRPAGRLNVIGGGKARVSAEVFQMYYGHYRRGTMMLEPGDSAVTEVRVPEDLYIFDIELVTREVAHSLLGIVPDDRNRFIPPPSRAPGTNDDPNAPIIRDPLLVTPDTPGGRSPGAPIRQPQQPVEAPVELPEGVTAAPTRIPVRMDAVLLDVVQLPIGPTGGEGEKPLFYVYFETEGGVVEHRRPDLDQQTAAYELVRASYLLGQATGSEEEE